LEGLGMENVIWYDLWPFGVIYVWPFGIVCGHLVYISRFGMFGPRKIWQPCFRPWGVAQWNRLHLPPRRLELWVVRSNPVGVKGGSFLHI
jgi:hypothetical protein